MSYTKLLLIVLLLVPAFYCLSYSGSEPTSTAAENNQVNESKLTNVNVESSSLQVEMANDSIGENDDDCCNSLSPCGDSDNDFAPVVNTVSSSQSSERFVVAMRVWRDFDDTYSTNAELLSVAVDSQEVKLLKDNGVTVTVPVSMLSRHDQNYILAFVKDLSRASSQVVGKFVD